MKEPTSRIRLSQAGLETLARVQAVGSCSWIEGSYPSARLDDIWYSALHMTTVRNLVRDGYLVPTGIESNHVLSENAIAVLAKYPEIRGRAATFYQTQTEAARQRIRVDKPDFGRTTMSREVKPRG